MRKHIRHIKKDFIHDTAVYVFSLLFIILLSLIVKINPNDVDIVHNFNFKNDKNKSEIPTYNLDVFDNLIVEARAYVVYDILNDKIIYGYNENEKMPLASLTKIMTALTSLSMGSPDVLININKKNKYDLGLKKNQEWRLDELLKYTLVFSSNDGAFAIADGLSGEKSFVETMNKKTKDFHLDLNFNNPAGLDEGEILGGEGSAYEVAKLISLANKLIPEILDSTTHKRASVISSNGKINGIPNTNQNVNDIVGLLSSKTGYTDLAGGNLVITFDVSLGHPIAIVVLDSTKDGRFSDAYKLYEATKEAVK